MFINLTFHPTALSLAPSSGLLTPPSGPFLTAAQLETPHCRVRGDRVRLRRLGFEALGGIYLIANLNSATKQASRGDTVAPCTNAGAARATGPKRRNQQLIGSEVLL